MKFTETIVADAKRSEHFPTGNAAFVDPDDLIAFANEEMKKRVIPFLMKFRQDYFLTEFPLIPLVNNQYRYSIPERAIGDALKEVFYVPDSSQPRQRQPLVKSDVHDSATMNATSTTPFSFHMESNYLVLDNTPLNPPTGSALSMLAFMRPSELISTSSCAKITAISVGATQTTLTVDTNLTASLSAGSLVDVISGKLPARFRGFDCAIQSISSTQIVLKTLDIDNEALSVIAQVNDYVCPAGYTNIPMIPDELCPILSELICARVNKAQGAIQNYQASMAEVKEGLENIGMLIKNRIEAQVETIYTNSGFLSSLNTGFKTLPNR
jgi:hypothetical protein